MRMLLCALVMGMLVVPDVAEAQDYKPVVCKTAEPYVGPEKKTVELNFSEFLSEPVSADFPSDVTATLQEAFTKAKTLTGAHALTAAVSSPAGHWQQADGTKLYYWASVGKTFTAVAVLQAVEEGRLRLDDTVSKWIDGVPNGDVITISHLLTHTSGLFSANEDLTVRKTQPRLSLEDEITILKRHGAMFCPGENWRYSNSGYTLLGEILEQVERKPYDRIVTEGIIDRLRLTDMRVITASDPLTDVEPPVSQSAEPAIDMQVPGAAGGIVASAPAMVAVWQGLLSGHLLKTATVSAMFADLYPMFGQPEYYGQGVMLYNPPVPNDQPPILWLGHSGGAPGVKAIVAYSPADKTFVAVAMAGDGSALMQQHPRSALFFQIRR
jgi:D-alanyl-D-alanine carboxypeptidase